MSTPDQVARLLAAHYGVPPRPRPASVLDSLVQTLLSLQTTAACCRAAHASLHERFPDWEAVRAAAPEQLAEAIAPAGLSHVRARRLQDLLARVADEFGELELEALRGWPDQAVRDWLLTLDGVGPKTAACVLLFGLQRADFPVDTHVHRLALRLGWLPARTGAEAAYRLLRDQIDPALRFGLHMNLVRHGREVCAAQRPRCAACVLADVCPSTQPN